MRHLKGVENQRIIAGSFANDHDTLGAVRASRDAGHEIIDVFGPFPIHGIEEAMGIRPTRLPWVCFFAGIVGLSLAMLFQYWTSASDWAINVGGKPFNSLPAFVPVGFEMTVLFAGLSTVAAFLIRSRLFPGKKHKVIHSPITDDRFVILLAETGRALDSESVRAIWADHGVLKVAESTKELDQ